MLNRLRSHCRFALFSVSTVAACTLLIATIERVAIPPFVPEVAVAPKEGGRAIVAPDRPDEYVRWRRLSLVDENGEIDPDGVMKAKAHVDFMRAMQPEAPSSAGIGRNTWRSIGPGNFGGRIRSILIHPTSPDTMLLGSVTGGIWKTTNGGVSWSPVQDFMANLGVSTMVMQPGNPNIMYAGTGEYTGPIRGGGIFKSIDGGTSWTQLPSTSTAPSPGLAAANFYYVNRLAISPDGTTLLAATWAGIFRSTDGGATFVRTTPVISGSIGFPDVRIHPTDSTRAVASTWTGEAIYSRDGGATWLQASGMPGGSTFRRSELAYAPNAGNIVYASVDLEGGSLYKSTNGGESYTEVFDGLADTAFNPLGSQGWYDNMLFVSPTDANFVIWGGIDQFRSLDGGITFARQSRWQAWALAAPTSAHADQHVAVAHPGFNGTTNRIVFFGNDGGIYRANDVTTVGGGVSPYTSGWTELNNGLAITQLYGAAGHPGTGRIVGGTQDNGTIFYNPGRTNPAENWSWPFGGDGGFNAYDPTDVNYFYGEYIYLTIHRNTSGGASFSSYIYNGLTDAETSEAEFIAAFILDPNNSNRLLGASTRLWRSNTAKAVTPTWEVIKDSLGITNGDRISAIAVAPGNADIIYTGHNSGRVYRTGAGTAAAASVRASWAAIDDNGATNPLPNRRVTRVAVDPRDHNTVYITFGGFSGNNLYKSTNGGATWTDITGPSGGATALPDVPIRDVDIHPNNSNWLYVGTEIGIFTSEDGGTSWGLPHDGPANVPVDELFFLNTTLYAATHGRGVFATTTDRVQTAPLGFTATVNGNTVTFAWGPPLGIAPDSYQIDAGVSAGTTLASLPAGSGTSFTLPGVPDGVFFARVRGRQGSTLGPVSNEVMFAVGSAARPGSPTGLTGSVSGNVLSLAWVAPPSGGTLTNYQLTARDDAGQLLAVVPLPPIPSFTATPPDGTYRLSVFASGPAGSSEFSSNEVTLTVPGPCNVPNAVQNLRRSGSGSQVVIQWDPPASGPLASAYRLEAGLSPGTSNAAVLTLGGTILQGTAPSGTYFVRVFATNNCGSSAASSELTLVVP